MRSLRYIMGAAARRRTGGGGGGSVSIVSSGSGSEGFSNTRTWTITSGLAAGDGILVMFSTGQTVTSITDNQSGSYTEITVSGNNKVYLRNNVGGTLPTTVTVTLSGNDFFGLHGAVLRGLNTTTPNQTPVNDNLSAFDTSHSVPYTTTGAGQAVLGVINFTGGGLTTFTPDGNHTWLSFGVSPQFFLRALATAGSYSATGTTNAATGGNYSTVILQP